jgi:hypothetical protein
MPANEVQIAGRERMAAVQCVYAGNPDRRALLVVQRYAEVRAGHARRREVVHVLPSLGRVQQVFDEQLLHATAGRTVQRWAVRRPNDATHTRSARRTRLRGRTASASNAPKETPCSRLSMRPSMADCEWA